MPLRAETADPFETGTQRALPGLNGSHQAEEIMFIWFKETIDLISIALKDGCCQKVAAFEISY